MSKVSITSDNNAFFLIIVLLIFRVFSRKRREHLKLCYLAIFLFVILLLKFQIKNGFPFNFTSLKKCSTNEFFNFVFEKGLHFLHISTNSLLPKIEELKCIVNKTKAAIIGITESKLDHTVPDLEVNLPGYDIL